MGKPPVQLIPANPTWAFGLVIISCVVGALLLVVGVWAEIAVALDGILCTTFIVSGLGLIFGAFGSQATVQYKKWVVTGVAATSLIFLFAIDYLRRDSYVVIELLTTKTPTTVISAGDATIKGSVTNEGSRLRTRFVVLHGSVRDTDVRILTEWPPRPTEVRSENRVEPLCLGDYKLMHTFGRGRSLAWRLSETAMKIRDDSNNLIASRAKCGIDDLGPSARLPSLLITSANAQSAPEVQALVQDLLSDNTDVRRLARESLANIGPPAIRPLMDRAEAMTATNDRLAFRAQIGAATAIDNMLSKGSKIAPPLEVSRQLNAADFEALIQWTFNRDQSLLGPTLRILANTADATALRSLMKAIERTSDENIIYNTAWILRQSAARYRSDSQTLAEIKRLSNSLRSRASGEKTTNFLNQTDAM